MLEIKTPVLLDSDAIQHLPILIVFAVVAAISAGMFIFVFQSTRPVNGIDRPIVLRVGNGLIPLVTVLLVWLFLFVLPIRAIFNT